ncbi:MAG: hypothetical protein WBQ86_16870, partial [Candidatus Binatus sp.]
MENDVVALFTTKSVQACLDVGGTQSWALNPDNAKKCRYAVLCRNPAADWGGKELRRAAFMIGRISPVVPSTEKVGRWMLTFDEYAIIEKADVWKDWRNPVRYTTLAELGISLAEIKFRPMPKKTMEAEAISVNAGAKVHQQAGVKMHQSGRGWFEFRQEEREGDFPPRPFEEL